MSRFASAGTSEPRLRGLRSAGDKETVRSALAQVPDLKQFVPVDRTVLKLLPKSPLGSRAFTYTPRSTLALVVEFAPHGNSKTRSAGPKVSLSSVLLTRSGGPGFPIWREKPQVVATLARVLCIDSAARVTLRLSNSTILVALLQLRIGLKLHSPGLRERLEGDLSPTMLSLEVALDGLFSSSPTKAQRKALLAVGTRKGSHLERNVRRSGQNVNFGPVGSEQTSVDTGVDGINVSSSLVTHKLTRGGLKPDVTQVAGPHFALLFGKRISLLLDAKVLSIKAGKRNLT